MYLHDKQYKIHNNPSLRKLLSVTNCIGFFAFIVICCVVQELNNHKVYGIGRVKWGTE